MKKNNKETILIKSVTEILLDLKFYNEETESSILELFNKSWKSNDEIKVYINPNINDIVFKLTSEVDTNPPKNLLGKYLCIGEMYLKDYFKKSNFPNGIEQIAIKDFFESKKFKNKLMKLSRNFEKELLEKRNDRIFDYINYKILEKDVSI